MDKFNKARKSAVCHQQTTKPMSPNVRWVPTRSAGEGGRGWYLALIAALLFMTACGPAPATTSVGPASRPVKLIEVNAASVERNNRYPAIIDASDSSTLSFQVSGKIVELLVSEAQAVSKGELIARLDQGDFKSRVDSARASYESANSEFERATRLAKRDAIAKSALDQRRSQRDIAKAQLDTARKALSDSEIRAPFSGLVASVPVSRLQTVSVGTNIATVINTKILDAVINLPASVISHVAAREDRSVTVILEAAPDREIAATYKEANLVADATSQTYAITFSFAAPEDLTVLPGMNATVILDTAHSGDLANRALAVPLAAVQGNGDEQYVWLFDADTMTVSKQEIVIEPGIGETVLVTSGLATGDQIVGAGGAYLSDSAPVTPWVE